MEKGIDCKTLQSWSKSFCQFTTSIFIFKKSCFKSQFLFWTLQNDWAVWITTGLSFISSAIQILLFYVLFSRSTSDLTASTQYWYHWIL